MEQTARIMASVAPLEPLRSRVTSLSLTLDVTDPEVVAELRRYPEGPERERYALGALRVGVLALRMANGQVDGASIREAGQALVSEVRELMLTRATEIHERVTATLAQYLDAQSGALPQRLHSFVRPNGELDRLLQSHVGTEGSLLARSLAAQVGEGSALFKLLSPTDAQGVRAQVAATVQDALLAQRTHILREFSLDQKDSALSRLVSEFSLDDTGSPMHRLSKMLAAASEQIDKNLSLDDEHSALSRLKRELQNTIDGLVRDNVEFQSQVREALARLDTRKKEEARTPRHGLEFEARLGEVLAIEARRAGDIYEATGGTVGVIKNCKVGDYVIELGVDSAAANARVVWEAKDRRGGSMRGALAEIDEARRNRQAQVGVFVFSSQCAPDDFGLLQRHGGDVLVVWNPEDPSSDLVVRAAYSLARALAVRERRSDHDSQAAIAEIEGAARAIEKQIAYLDDVRKWAETVKGHGEKIVDRTARMAHELSRDVDRLDAQVAAMRRTKATG